MVQAAFINLMSALRDKSEDGQTLVEYSLLIALIAIAAMGALTAFSISAREVLGSVETAAEAMLGALE